jgi:hypothetical protein
MKYSPLFIFDNFLISRNKFKDGYLIVSNKFEINFINRKVEDLDLLLECYL